MTQLNDAYADLPVKDRIALFESHIKPFGAHDKRKVTLGGKWITKYNKNPNPYDTTRADQYLKKKTYEPFISSPNKFPSRKTDSLYDQTPEVNDNHIKPFGGDIPQRQSLGGKSPEPKRKYPPTPRDENG